MATNERCNCNKHSSAKPGQLRVRMVPSRPRDPCEKGTSAAYRAVVFTLAFVGAQLKSQSLQTSFTALASHVTISNAVDSERRAQRVRKKRSCAERWQLTTFLA